MNGHELLSALLQFSSEDLDLPVCSRQGEMGDAGGLNGIWVAHDNYEGDMLLLDYAEPEANEYASIQPGREPIVVEADIEPAPAPLDLLGALQRSLVVRPEEITQCHCGCARSVHVDRAGYCTLCGHCPRYRVRTGPVF